MPTRLRRACGPALMLISLSLAGGALAADEAADARVESDQGSDDPSEAWVDLRWRGPHLDVDFTPTLHQLFPPDEEPRVPMIEDSGGGAPSLKVHAEEMAGGNLSFFILPDIRYNPDEGLGVGVAIPLVWSEPDVQPYKYSFVVQLVASTKLVQDHVVFYDLVDLFGLPIRISGNTGFYAFADEPFCGVGSVASCNRGEAEAAVDAAGLTGAEAEAAVDHYYLMRLVRPYNATIVRLELFDLFGKWEVFGGLRSEAYFPGFFANPFDGRDLDDDQLLERYFTSGPYAGSLLAARDRHGEPGFVNVPQVGLMLDTRDFEPSPREGYWLETSMRAASTWALSSWSFVGFNATGRFYAPLVPSRNLTLATRVVADVILGDAPVQELARFGGSQGYRGFGGRWVGRGLRQQHFIGNVKLAYQSELRWDAIRFDISGFSLGFEFLTFLDAGVVLAEDVDYVGVLGVRRPFRPLLSFGVGLRWVINKNIVVRADLGLSPDEQFAPQFYFDGRHIF